MLKFWKKKPAPAATRPGEPAAAAPDPAPDAPLPLEEAPFETEAVPPSTPAAIDMLEQDIAAAAPARRSWRER
ncbi:MAG: signal recognition particle-docking protein FtsY, partial [Dokdonella sp.]